jgi:hypothetical protein
MRVPEIAATPTARTLPELISRTRTQLPIPILSIEGARSGATPLINLNISLAFTSEHCVFTPESKGLYLVKVDTAT